MGKIAIRSLRIAKLKPEIASNGFIKKINQQNLPFKRLNKTLPYL
jgi:hypothetical protein